MGALARNEFLASGGASFSRLRLHPWQQSGRSEDRPGGGGIDWLLFVSHAAADGRFVVGCRLSHGVGLGRELSVLRSRQRDGSAWAPAQLQLARSRLADGRRGWAGGKRPRCRGDRSALGSV